jgi:hypothetical protein
MIIIQIVETILHFDKAKSFHFRLSQGESSLGESSLSESSLSESSLSDSGLGESD